jgi:hypothetical protein
LLRHRRHKFVVARGRSHEIGQALGGALPLRWNDYHQELTIPRNVE